MSPKHRSAIVKTIAKRTSPDSSCSYTRSARKKANERVIQAIDNQMTRFIELHPELAKFYDSLALALDETDGDLINTFLTVLHEEEKRFAAGDVVKVLIPIHCNS